MAFPNVDPSLISTLSEGRHQNEKPVAGSAVLQEVTDSFDRPHLWYSTSEVIHALELFIASGDELSESSAYRLAPLSTKNLTRISFFALKVFALVLFDILTVLLRYDLVDLTRQALSKYANQLFLKVIEAYHSNDVLGVARDSKKFLDLVEDMDALLACHDGFLLGPWLESAKKLAQDEEQEKQVRIPIELRSLNKLMLARKTRFCFFI